MAEIKAPPPPEPRPPVVPPDRSVSAPDGGNPGTAPGQPKAGTETKPPEPQRRSPGSTESGLFAKAPAPTDTKQATNNSRVSPEASRESGLFSRAETTQSAKGATRDTPMKNTPPSELTKPTPNAEVTKTGERLKDLPAGAILRESEVRKVDSKGKLETVYSEQVLTPPPNDSRGKHADLAPGDEQKHPGTEPAPVARDGHIGEKDVAKPSSAYESAHSRPVGLSSELLESMEADRKAAMNERNDAETRANVERQAKHEEMAHFMVQHIADGESYESGAAGATVGMALANLWEGIKPNTEDWVAIANAGAGAARSHYDRQQAARPEPSPARATSGPEKSENAGDPHGSSGRSPEIENPSVTTDQKSAGGSVGATKNPVPGSNAGSGGTHEGAGEHKAAGREEPPVSEKPTKFDENHVQNRSEMDKSEKPVGRQGEDVTGRSASMAARVGEGKAAGEAPRYRQIISTGDTRPQEVPVATRARDLGPEYAKNSNSLGEKIVERDIPTDIRPDAQPMSNKSHGFDAFAGARTTSLTTEETKNGLNIFTQKMSGGEWLQIKGVSRDSPQLITNEVNASMKKFSEVIRESETSPGTFEINRSIRENAFERTSEGSAYRTSYDDAPNRLTIVISLEKGNPTRELLEVATRAARDYSDSYEHPLPPIKIQIVGPPR